MVVDNNWLAYSSKMKKAKGACLNFPLHHIAAMLHTYGWIQPPWSVLLHMFSMQMLMCPQWYPSPVVGSNQ